MTSTTTNQYNYFLQRTINKTNQILLVLFFAIGGIIGFFKSYTSETLYRSKITAESTLIKSEIIVDLVNDLSLLITEEPHFLAKKMNVSLSAAKALRKIIPMQVKEFEGKNTVRTDRFIINVHAATEKIEAIDSIHKGILSMIENNVYVQQQIEFERSRIMKLKEEIAKKILELEDLQKRSLDEIEVTQEFFSYHQHIVQLFAKQSELEKELQKTVAFMVIEQDPYSREIKPDYVDTVLHYALWSAFSWMVILVIVAFFRMLNQVN